MGSSPVAGQDRLARVRQLGWVALVLVGLVGLWEGYKALAAFTSWPLPVRSTSVPHVWDIVAALAEPVQRGRDQSTFAYLIESSLFTFREAAAGFVAGGLIGFGLGVVLALFRPLERGLMPYVIASQTVPLLAIAPMVVVWSSKAQWPTWVAVSVIAAYLTFFPVTINTLRGLQSPEPTALELMRSYASSRWATLWKVQVPSALPYVFTALKVSATASVIGAIVGELPASLNAGLGRALLSFSYFFATGPEKVYGAVVVAGLLGMLFVGAVTLVERLTLSRWHRDTA